MRRPTPRSIGRPGAPLHFAAHSHHPWPDATESAHASYWADSATLADRKWGERVMAQVIPAAQDHVARLLALSDARQVAFAPNTHEFVVRLYSCLDWSRPVRVLASAHEFHSFRRQTRRLVETGRVILEEVTAQPWESFTDRFARAAAQGHWDLVWASHVHFDSGFVVPALEKIAAATPRDALLVIDGYHAFCALPVDLAALHRRAFYIAGGYKYAMAGEGACFLAIPPGCELRPVDTGWYAAMDTLSGPEGTQVPYGSGATRFWGATFDPSGLYRFNAAMDWLRSTGTTIADLAPDQLVPPRDVERGNFLTFDVDDAEGIHRRLLDARIYLDRRDRRIRFGFGIYHDEAMVDRLIEATARALR